MASIGNENQIENIQAAEERAKRVKKEILKLRKSFKNIPKNYMNVVCSLVETAAFTTVLLEDLQKTINTQGATQKYKNGENQWGVKKSPEVEIYNTTVKNHATIIKQLCDLIPAGEKVNKEPEKPDAFQTMMEKAHGKK